MWRARERLHGDGALGEAVKILVGGEKEKKEEFCEGKGRDLGGKEKKEKREREVLGGRERERENKKKETKKRFRSPEFFFL